MRTRLNVITVGYRSPIYNSCFCWKGQPVSILLFLTPDDLLVKGRVLSSKGLKITVHTLYLLTLCISLVVGLPWLSSNCWGDVVIQPQKKWLPIWWWHCLKGKWLATSSVTVKSQEGRPPLDRVKVELIIGQYAAFCHFMAILAQILSTAIFNS